MSGERPSINVIGVDFAWDLERHIFLSMGLPSISMWIGTMAGFMSGLQKMVGTERFNLAVQGSGREGAEAEWRVISSFPTVEEGLAWAGRSLPVTGMGAFEMISLDRAGKEARFRCRSTWEGLYQKELGVCWGSSSMGGRLAGYCGKIFGTNCWAEQTSFLARGDEYDEFVVRPSSQTVESELDALLSTDKATRADLATALETLRREVEQRRQAQATSADLTSTLEKLRREVEERQRAEDRLREEVEERQRAEQQLRKEVEERQRAEQQLRREVAERQQVAEELQAKLAIIGQQEEAIRAMSTPILQLWEGVLTMPVVGLVDTPRASGMMESLLEAITQTQSRFTILDLTGMDILDTSAANHLLNLVRAAALLGTTCLISGISPQMAQTIVGLGVDLGALLTFGTLEAALRHAIAQTLKKPVSKRRG
jgi:rsbT co-antagonist protein RsbR